MRKSILDLLINETSAFTEYSVSLLKDHQQHKPLVEARKTGFLAGRILGIKNEAIGLIFGNRNHSTVSVGIKSALAQFKFVEASVIADRVREKVNLQQGLDQSDWRSHMNTNSPGVLDFRKSAFYQPVFRKKISAQPPEPPKSVRPKIHTPIWDRPEGKEIADKRAAVIARLG